MPPVAETDTVAFPPKHAIAVITLEDATKIVGCGTFKEVLAVQPLLSVTVNDCEPAVTEKVPVPL